MNTDFRIAVGFFGHPKTRRLIATLGLPAAWAMLRLWEYATQHKPSGELRGMSPEQVAFAAEYEGDPTAWVEGLIELRWLERNRRFIYIHEWEIHQPFVVQAPAREAKARKAARARWNKDTAPDAPSMPGALLRASSEHARSNAPYQSVPDRKEHPPSPPRRERSGVAYTAGFLQAWKAFPHFEQRSKKRETFEVWRRLALEPLAESITAWIEAGRKSDDWIRDAGARVPGMQVWLKGRDFSEPAPVAKATPRPALAWDEPNRLLTPEEQAQRGREGARRGSA